MFAAFAVVIPAIDDANAEEPANGTYTLAGEIKFSALEKPKAGEHKGVALDVKQTGNNFVFDGFVTAGYKTDAKVVSSAPASVSDKTNYAEWAYLEITGVDSSKKITGTNPALAEITKDASTTIEATSATSYVFPIPRAGSGADATVTLKIGDATYTFDFSKVSTATNATALASGTGVFAGKYTVSDSTKLELNGYTGKDLFYGVTEVTLKGTNTINAYGNADLGHGEGSYAIKAKDNSALTVKAGAEDASLTINQHADAFTVYSAGALTIGDSLNAKTTTMTIDGGNRGLYSGTSIALYNSVVTISVSEKGIRTTGNASPGTLEMTNSTANVDLKTENKHVNGEESDDRFGVKVTALGTISADSTLNTDGLRLKTAPTQAIQGKIIIDNYEQNPSAKMTPLIAGFYSDAPVIKVSAYRTADTKTVGIYLINDAGAYNIDVKNGTGDSAVVTEKTVSTIADAQTALKTDDTNKSITKVTFVVPSSCTGADLTVLDNKELVINATNPYNGTIATGSGNGKQSATFTNVTGSFSITKGSIVINGETIDTPASGSAASIKLADGDVMVINSITLGNLTITTETGDEATVIVKPGQTVTIADTKKLTLSNGIVMEVYGSVVKEATTAIPAPVAGAIVNNAQVKLMSGGSVTAAVTGNDLSYDESLMSDMTVSGVTDVGNTVFSSKNIVTVNGSWTLINGSNVTVKGKLVVPEGATLTIEVGASLTLVNSATLQLDGNLVIEAADETVKKGGALDVTRGTVLIDGTATVSGVVNVDATNGKVYVNQDGVLDIDADGVLNATGAQSIFIEPSGIMNVKGAFSGIVTNKGTVTIDSNVAATADSKIVMAADGAVVDVVAYTVTAAASVETSNKLTITDDGMVLTTYRDSDAKKDIPVTVTGKDDIVITPALTGATAGNYNVTVSGITVVSKISSEKAKADATEGVYNQKQYSKSMDISGSIAASYALKENATAGTTDKPVAGATVALSNDAKNTGFVVSGKLDVSSNIAVNNAGLLSVTGAIAAASDAKFDNTSATTASISVTGDGEVAVPAKLTGKVQATQYVTKAKDSTGKEVATYHYVDINNALKIVSAEGSVVKEIVLVGEQTVTADATVPADVTLDIKDQTLNINKSGAEITLTIAKGATVKGSGKIIVADTLFAEDKSNVKVTDDKITSDVKTEEIGEDGKATKNGWAKWTNLTVALAEAPEGSVITVTGEEVTLESNTTVKSGVTLVIPATSHMVLNSGVTLTVDGILKTDGQIYAKGGFDLTAQKVTTGTKAYSSTVIVNGKLMSGIETVYADGSAPDSEGPTLAGYDALFKGTNTGYGAPIAGAYYTEGAYYVIAGIDTALADVSKIDTEILIHGKVTGGDLTVKGTENMSKIVLSNDDVESGGKDVITELTVKSIVLDGVELNVKNLNTATNKAYFSGSAVIGDASVTAKHATGFTFAASSSKAYIAGTVDISDKDDSFAVAAGKVYTGEGFGVTTGSENAMAVATGAELIADKTGTIGALVVDGTLSVPANKILNVTDLTVNGTVSVDAATSTSGSGTLKVTNLYVGVSASDITGAAAVFNGPVDFIGSAYMVIVAPSATVDDAFLASLEGLKSTAVHVGDAVWFTAYTSDDAQAVAIAPSKIPVKNVELRGWTNENGAYASTTATSSIEGVSYASGVWTVTIGKNTDLYADLNAEVYKIVIKADEGIADVYLNGQAMAYGLVSNGNSGFYYAYSAIVAAGDYKVTYTLKNGWSGDAKLAGDNVSGMSFSVSGSYAADKVYQLTGVEKSGYVEPVTPSEDKDDDGLTITDYLLIVLVVLIVILAVIVAMRLMRS